MSGGWRDFLGPAIALLLALFPAVFWSAEPASAADDLRAVPIGTFTNPVYVAVAPGQPRLLFVVERAGQIQVMRDEQRLSRPFLDIRSIVRGIPDDGAGSEQGLLSMAFAPDYQQSGLFYVFFTNNDGDVEIAEFRRRTVVRADAVSRRTVLVIPHRDAQNHNGGQLQFGPGGLYISVGDGGKPPPGFPRGDHARDLDSLLGKILRIDPAQDGANSYSIPHANPFVGREGRDEIFSYGLRHPWRFSFDGNRIVIGDVGQGRREEVNFLHRRAANGANFGWPQYEGELVFDDTRPGPDPATFPIHTYSHDDGCAVIGGYVVRDPDLPELIGRYLYGDVCSGDIRSFRPNADSQNAVGDRSTGLILPRMSSFGQGFNGQLYVAQVRDTTGTVSRLEAPAP